MRKGLKHLGGVDLTIYRGLFVINVLHDARQ